MKTITVDFSSPKPIQPFYGGELGENRAVYLNIIPSTDMSEDEDIAIYYVAFTVNGGIILSETFNQGEDISISLGSVITEQRKACFQLIATSADGESVISKSPIVQLFLGNSITGDVIPDPITGDTIYTEIAALVEAAEHIDLSDYYTKTEVDTIASGKIDKVSGKGLSTEDYTTAEKTKLSTVSENANANVIESIATADGSVLTPVNKRITLPATDSSMVEIRQGTNVSKFTASEISEMYANNTPMCYGGTPITSVLIVSLAGGTKEAYLGILYCGTTVTEAQTLKVNESKQITIYENGTTLTDAKNSEISANTAARHSHSNKTVLDKFGESSGAPTYNGSPIGGGNVDDVRNTAGQSLVSSGIATIPDEVVEIWDTVQSKLAYTVDEILSMKGKKSLYYRGNTVVVIAETSTTPRLMQIYYITRNNYSPYNYVLKYDEYAYDGTRESFGNNAGRWSDENYTSTEKTKLSGIATGAEVNVIDTIKDSNGNPLTVTSKSVTLPAIPDAQIQSDWEQSDNTAKDYIKNKPSIPAAQVQADWNESDNTKADYIKNKPDLSIYAQSSSLATVATSGSYNDLSNTPTIPTAGTITSGSTGYATGGDVYTELQNIPSMPSGTNNGDILVWDGSAWVTAPAWRSMYQPCEYIESSGTQYIDTGVPITSDLRMVLERANVNTGDCIEGALYSVSSTRSSFSWATNGATNYNFGSLVGSNTSAWMSSGVPADTNKHTVDLASGSQKLDGVEYGTQTIVANTLTIGLFAWHAGGNFDTRYSARVYSCKFYNGNTLIRDYIPVYNVFNGEAGLLDKVNSKFYGNQGIGTFTKGADVN